MIDMSLVVGNILFHARHNADLANNLASTRDTVLLDVASLCRCRTNVERAKAAFKSAEGQYNCFWNGAAQRREK